MRYGTGLASLALLLGSAGAGAQDLAHESSCPLPPSAPSVKYTRLHQIPTTAADEDVSHTIVTPGGMVLHSPNLVAATDVLTVVARDPEAVCFHLVTLAREWHKCEIDGVARKEPQGWYLFNDGDVAVRLTFAGDDHVDVAPVGAAYRSRCEPSGRIDSASYTLDTRSK